MVAWALTIPLFKRLTQGLVTGWASLVTRTDGTPIVDSDGDIIPIDELRRAVHSAMLEADGRGRAGDMHEVQGVADIVDSIVVTKELRKAAGFGEGPEGWLVTLRINDPQLRAQIESGEKLELSIRGEGERIDIGEVP